MDYTTDNLVEFNMRVLGFDISSTTTAYALISYEGGISKLLECGYIKPIKNGHIIERLANTRNQIKTIIFKLKPDIIVIEDILQFMKNKSTAKTIVTLTAFNRMIGLISYDYLNIVPELLNVNSIRHCLKNLIELECVPKKEDIPDVVAEILNIDFPWEYNKKHKIKMENYDKADAMAVALTYIYKPKTKRGVKREVK
jgi:Holliday junction resolvasome RuvABC endonuclease subunit